MPRASTHEPDGFDLSESEAVLIYQVHLDETSKGLLCGDFDTFRSRICLPHNVTTQTEHFVIATEDEMRTTFRNVHQTLKMEGVTHIVRIVKSAEFESPTVIIGTHETHRMKDARRLVGPYWNRVRLEKCEDGLWRETHCANAVKSKAGKFELAEQSLSPNAVPQLQILSERKTK